MASSWSSSLLDGDVAFYAPEGHTYTDPGSSFYRHFQLSNNFCRRFSSGKEGEKATFLYLKIAYTVEETTTHIIGLKVSSLKRFVSGSNSLKLFACRKA